MSDEMTNCARDGDCRRAELPAAAGTARELANQLPTLPCTHGYIVHSGSVPLGGKNR